MAVCNSCQQRYDDPSVVVCLNCGDVLQAEVPVQTATSEAATRQPSPNEASHSAGREYNIGDGNTNVNTGQGGTVIFGATETEYCAAGDEEFVSSWRKFRCSVCGRRPVCENHYDAVGKMCSVCLADKSSVSTSPSADDERQEKLREFAEQLEQDEQVAINTAGTFVPREELTVQGGKLVDGKGNQVSTLKKNIWYARPRQWYQVRPKRVQTELRAMEKFYPQMKLDTDPKFSRDAFWQGVLQTTTGNNYEIRVQYRRSFQITPPRVWITNPKIKMSRHIYADGHLCFFHKEDNTWQPKTTSATMVSWTAAWLHSYEVWLETSEWPGAEHDQVVVEPEY